MAWRPSIALRNYMLENGSFKQAMSNGCIKLYTGTQPATSEAAPTGTLLCTYSVSSGALTREILPVGVVTLSVGATTGDTVTTFTINSLEIKGVTTAWNTSLTQTAADVVRDINNYPGNQLYMASSSGAVITITGKPGVNTLLNAKAIAVGVGGNMIATVTSTTFGSATGGGVAGVAAANALRWGNAATGILAKDLTQTWSGVAGNSGTAGWFRIEASATDAGALDSAEAILRCDGSVGTSGAELNLATTTITSGATQTIDSFNVTFPTA